MATAATIRPRDTRAPIPSNYFCKSCGLEAHHWIMDCSLLAIFHAAKNLLNSITNGKKKDHKEDLADSLVQIRCKESHSISECQSLIRIIMALRFYQSNAYNNSALLSYFNRYPHLLNDYTHILSDHLDEDKEMNDINAAIIHNKMDEYIKCDITNCPHFIRHQHHHHYQSNTANDEIVFYKNTLDTIHCYFLHPFHTGFKMIKRENEEKKDEEDDDNMVISWEDEELTHLQTELNERRHLLRSIRGIEYNKFNKFIINIPSNSDKDSYFGKRYYYWNWYKNNEKEDWRCNEGKRYCELYIHQRYPSIKEEITSNNVFRLNLISFNTVYVKASNYLNSHIIRRMKSSGNQLCHYGINDGSLLQLGHLISIILYSDYRELSFEFVKTFRRLNLNETESDFKRRKSEYCLWSKYLRETVELYGTPLNESKINIFYVTISSSIVFSSFYARFCVPTSTTNQLQIVTMCTQNGLILELESTDEIASFYSGLLKYFNCSLISRFGEENERLFIGGWAPLQFNNIRILIEKKENYYVFIHAIQHFNAVLDGEEADDIDNSDDNDSRLQSRCNTSYLSRAFTRSYESSCSQYTQYTEIGNNNDNKSLWTHCISPHKMECNKMDGLIMDTLCNKRNNNGFPEYINMMFKQILNERDNIFINLDDLMRNYGAFGCVLLSLKCDCLIRFDVVNALCINCRIITVDMNKFEQLNTQYLLGLCQQMVEIEKSKTKLEKIVLLRVKRECITLDIWSKINRKYNKFCDKLWFKCLSRFRYNFEKDLKLFFDENAYNSYLKTQKEEAANDDEIWRISAPKSHRL